MNAYFGCCERGLCHVYEITSTGMAGQAHSYIWLMFNFIQFLIYCEGADIVMSSHPWRYFIK